MAKDSPRIRGTTPQIQQAARHPRQNLTPAEAKLWSLLQKRQQNGLTTALTLIKTAIKTLSPPELGARGAWRETWQQISSSTPPTPPLGPLTPRTPAKKRQNPLGLLGSLPLGRPDIVLGE